MNMNYIYNIYTSDVFPTDRAVVVSKWLLAYAFYSIL